MLIEIDHLGQIPSDKSIRCCAISNKGHLAIATQQYDLYLYNELNLSQKTYVQSFVHQLEFTNDNQYLIYSTHNRIYFLKIDSILCKTYSINRHQQLLTIPNSMQFLFVQNQCYGDYNSKNVCHFDFKSNKRIRKIEIEMEKNYYPIVMTFSRDKLQICAGIQNIFVIDLLKTDIIWCELSRTQGMLQQLAFVDQSKILALRMQCTYLQLFSSIDGDLLIQVDIPGLQCISQFYVQNNALYILDEETGLLYRQWNDFKECIHDLGIGSQVIFSGNKLLYYSKLSLRVLEGI